MRRAAPSPIFPSNPGCTFAKVNTQQEQGLAENLGVEHVPSLVLYRDGETRAWHDLPTDWADSFRLAGRDFVDALLEGRTPEQTGADARQTLAFALAAARSAAEGREVALAEIEA